MPGITNRALINTEVAQDIDDILAEVNVIVEHFHNKEIWFGLAGAPSGTHFGDEDTLTPYVAISGAGVYGADANDEANVLGVDDIPARAGMTMFDMHRIFIIDFSHAAVYVIRIVWGTTTMAQGIIDENFTTIPVITTNLPVAQSGGVAFDVLMPRLISGVDKVWVQCKNVNNNASLDFLVGIHEYPV